MVLLLYTRKNTFLLLHILLRLAWQRCSCCGSPHILLPVCDFQHVLVYVHFLCLWPCLFVYSLFSQVDPTFPTPTIVPVVCPSLVPGAWSTPFPPRTGSVWEKFLLDYPYLQQFVVCCRPVKSWAWSEQFGTTRRFPTMPPAFSQTGTGEMGVVGRQTEQTVVDRQT